MKWSESSLFRKVMLVAVCLCLVGAIALLVLSLTEVLPFARVTPWWNVLFGLVWLGLGIINWKTQRILAIVDFVVALMKFVTALLGWIL